METSPSHSRFNAPLFFSVLALWGALCPTAQAQCSQRWLQQEFREIGIISERIGGSLDRVAPSIVRRIRASKHAQGAATAKGARLHKKYQRLLNESETTGERLARLEPNLPALIFQKNRPLIEEMTQCERVACESVMLRAYKIEFNRTLSRVMRASYPALANALDGTTNQLAEIHKALAVWEQEWKVHSMNYQGIKEELRSISPRLARDWEHLDERVMTYTACEKRLGG
jgi:hypothetical protein